MALCTCSSTCFGGQVKRIPCAQELLGCIARKRKTNLHILKPNWALQRLSVKITSEWTLFQCSLFHETPVSLCLAWLWISCWSGFSKLVLELKPRVSAHNAHSLPLGHIPYTQLSWSYPGEAWQWAEPDLLDQVIVDSEPHLCCSHLIPGTVSIVFQTAGFG